MRIGDLSREIRDRFRSHDLETADLDARLLVAHALEVDTSSVILRSEDEASEVACQKARSYADQRIAGMPVGRILGHREFWGLELDLNPETLEPRPDTEVLVEAVLARTNEQLAFRFADIGSGTGAIGIALLSERINAECVAVDISEAALRSTRDNAEKHGVASRLLPVQGNFGSALAAGFDWIISNPPYIRTDVVANLAPEVCDHDPIRALDGGADGLDAFRAIISDAGFCLRQNGRIAFEIGFDQGEAVSARLAQAGFFDIEIIQDLSGNDRVVVARHNKTAAN